MRLFNRGGEEQDGPVWREVLDRCDDPFVAWCHLAEAQFGGGWQALILIEICQFGRSQREIGPLQYLLVHARQNTAVLQHRVRVIAGENP